MDPGLKLCLQDSISLCCLHQFLSMCRLHPQTPHVDKMAAIASASQPFIFISSMKEKVGFSKSTNLNVWELSLIGSDWSTQPWINYYYQRNTMFWLARLAHLTSLEAEMESTTSENPTDWKQRRRKLELLQKWVEVKYLKKSNKYLVPILLLLLLFFLFLAFWEMPGTHFGRYKYLLNERITSISWYSLGATWSCPRPSCPG